MRNSVRRIMRVLIMQAGFRKYYRRRDQFKCYFGSYRGQGMLHRGTNSVSIIFVHLRTELVDLLLVVSSHLSWTLSAPPLTQRTPFGFPFGFPFEARKDFFRIFFCCLTLSVPVVLLNSPNLIPYFSLSMFERISLLNFRSLLCLINFHFLITKCLILLMLCKEKLGVDN